MADSLTELQETGAFGGLRMTKQRQVVYEVVKDMASAHPTASAVYSEAKVRMPNISLATVYNCLETLSDAGAVTQVNIDREASRFCPNLMPHAHFFCSGCDAVYDIELRDKGDASSPWELPEGLRIESVDVAMRGTCPKCGKESSVTTK